MNAFLPYGKQSIDASDVAAVTESLKSPIITRGPEVEAFERELAEYCGVPYAVAFNSGSTALAAAFYAAKLTAQDRIISSPNTFVATVGAGMRFGGSPVFIDIDPKTGNMDIAEASATVNVVKTRGRPFLMPVHYSGLPVDMEQLDLQIANPECIVIEDAAHALGSSYPRGGPRVGSCAWSQMTVFSFHPVKNITTGEGGAVTTASAELRHRLQLFRGNGIERNPKLFGGEATPWMYEVHDICDNSHLTAFQAALGRSQLRRLDTFIAKRRALMKAYRAKVADLPWITLLSDAYDDHTAFHLCVAHIDFEKCKKSRAEVMSALKEQEIGSQVHYIPLYRHPYFVKLCGDLTPYFPHTETHYSQALSLPLYYDMELSDVDRVIDTLSRILIK